MNYFKILFLFSLPFFVKAMDPPEQPNVTDTIKSLKVEVAQLRADYEKDKRAQQVQICTSPGLNELDTNENNAPLQFEVVEVDALLEEKGQTIEALEASIKELESFNKDTAKLLEEQNPMVNDIEEDAPPTTNKGVEELRKAYEWQQKNKRCFLQ